jgi:hypothetical protein
MSEVLGLFGEGARQQCERVVLGAVYAGEAIDGLSVDDIADPLCRHLIVGGLVFGALDQRAVWRLARDHFAREPVNFYARALPVWMDAVQRQPSLVARAVAWLVANRCRGAAA